MAGTSGRGRGSFGGADSDGESGVTAATMRRGGAAVEQSVSKTDSVQMEAETHALLGAEASDPARELPQRRVDDSVAWIEVDRDRQLRRARTTVYAVASDEELAMVAKQCDHMSVQSTAWQGRDRLALMSPTRAEPALSDGRLA